MTKVLSERLDLVRGAQDILRMDLHGMWVHQGYSQDLGGGQPMAMNNTTLYCLWIMCSNAVAFRACTNLRVARSACGI